MTLQPRLRILHIHTLPIVSGSGINTMLTMIGSKRRGHHVALACESEGRLTEEAHRQGIEVLIAQELGREVDLLRDARSIFELAHIIQRERFDLVHTHNSKAGFVGRLAGRMARVRTVVHTVHGFSFHDAEAPAKRALFRVLEKQAARWCDGIIFISKPLEEWAIREGIGLKVPRRVIYSGIESDVFSNVDRERARAELGIRSHRLAVGIISKLWEGKGHHVLLRAWAKIISQWNSPNKPLLFVVGEGPLEGELHLLAKRLGIAESVVFTGFRSDIPEVTSAMDVSVLPSAFEGMGRVILEAMAAGKPVIASRVGGIPDLVVDNFNGLLIAPNNILNLESALTTILTDAPLRQRLAAGAASSIREEHTAHAMVDSIHDFYEELRRI